MQNGKILHTEKKTKKGKKNTSFPIFQLANCT